MSTARPLSLTLATAAVAMIAAVSTLGLAGCSRQEPAAEPVRAVRTMLVAPATAGASYEYAGEIRPRVESRLSFRVGGKIVERSANLGDTVRVGQTLARLDPRDLRLGEDVARAGMASADVNLKQAEADFKRYRDLRDQGFISSAELERRETSLKVAQAQLEQARAQSGVQGNQARYAALVADAGGVITGVDAEAGMVVSSGAPVLRIAHDGPRDVVFSVPEDKIAMIRALAASGGTVRVRLWSAGAADLVARIREISAAADPATRTFLVKADLGSASTGAGLSIGQTATIAIDSPRLAGIAKVPLSSLKEDHGGSTVWVVEPASMTVAQRSVRVGAAEGNDAVVLAGLTAGDRVVTAGVHVLSPGQKVRLYVDPMTPAVPARVPSPAAAASR